MSFRPRLIRVERHADEVRTPGEPFPDVRRIVVSRDDRLGDFVLTLPAVEALRRTYPGARLGLLVQPQLVPLARIVEGVDSVIEAGGDLRRLTARLRGFGADLLVSIARGARVPWAAARAGIPHRVGPGYRWYSGLFHRRVCEHRRAGRRHELEYALSFAHRAGAAAGPARFPLRIPPSIVAQGASRLASCGVRDPVALVHPGSGGSCPAWPVGHYLDLADRLVAAGISVVFSVGPDDAAVASAIDGSPGARRVPRLGGGLLELAAAAARAAIVVSNSTGPLHLAAAVGTPVLGLYPPWPTCGVSRWGPYAENGWAIEAPPPPGSYGSRRRRRRLGPELMAGIRPELVAAGVIELLGRRV
jgi:ADP-heptose:LPS heptosyltransferase